MMNVREIWANVVKRNNEHRFALAIQTTSGVRVAWGEQVAAVSKYELLELEITRKKSKYLRSFFFFFFFYRNSHFREKKNAED